MSAATDKDSVKVAARFLDGLHRFYFEHREESPEQDALLCYIFEQNRMGLQPCSTDLVRCRRFGTLPTLTVRLARLVDRGLVRHKVGADRRVHPIEVTPKGVALLEERSRQMGDGLGQNGPDGG